MGGAAESGVLPEFAVGRASFRALSAFVELREVVVPFARLRPELLNLVKAGTQLVPDPRTS